MQTPLLFYSQSTSVWTPYQISPNSVLFHDLLFSPKNPAIYMLWTELENNDKADYLKYVRFWNK